MIAQFGASRQRFITLVNQGSVPMKLRGKKKDQLEEEFASVRKSVVESVKEARSTDTSEYQCMTVERYKDTHHGRSPADDGLETSQRFHKGKLRECVLLPLQHDEEWKVTVSDKEA